MFLFNCIWYFLLICDFKSLNKYENSILNILIRERKTLS